MTIVKGEKNEWQTGDVNDGTHVIEKCGSHTGHTVRAVAFCNTAQTAGVLLDALRLLHSIHETGDLDADTLEDARNVLTVAGLLE